MNKRNAIQLTAAFIGANVAMAASIGVAGHIGLHAADRTVYAQSADDTAAALGLPVVYLTASGIGEDSAQWDCITDGNRVCGPNNPQGAPAACYDEGGAIVAFWPCHILIDPETGDSYVFDGLPGGDLGLGA